MARCSAVTTLTALNATPRSRASPTSRSSAAEWLSRLSVSLLLRSICSLVGRWPENFFLPLPRPLPPCRPPLRGHLKHVYGQKSKGSADGSRVGREGGQSQAGRRLGYLAVGKVDGIADGASPVASAASETMQNNRQEGAPSLTAIKRFAKQKPRKQRKQRARPFPSIVPAATVSHRFALLCTEKKTASSAK